MRTSILGLECSSKNSLGGDRDAVPCYHCSVAYARFLHGFIGSHTTRALEFLQVLSVSHKFSIDCVTTRPCTNYTALYNRLENEHLSNVGKFRAVKAVPLPFREMDFD